MRHDGDMTTPGATDPSQRTPQERASDPATTALELQQLAADHPEVRPAIAKHPAAYPALLDWLGALGDSAVNAALVERRAADAAPPAPAPLESAPEVAESSPVPVVADVSPSDDVAGSPSPAPVAAESAPEASSAPDEAAAAESPAEPEATQISPVSAEPAPVVTDVESAARQRASVFAAVQAAQEQTPAPTGSEDLKPAEETPAPTASPDVSDVIAGALGADVTERSEPSATEVSAPAPQSPANPFSREFSAQSPEQQQSAPTASQSVPEASPYAPAGYGVATGVSAPTAPVGAPGYGEPGGQYGQPGQYDQQGQAPQPGQYGQPGYIPEPAPAPTPKVHDGRGFATFLLISLALATSVIALWDSEVGNINPTVYASAAAALLLVAVAANFGVLFRGLRRGFAGLTLWAAWTFAALVPAAFYNITFAAVDITNAEVEAGSPLDMLMRSQNWLYSAIDADWGRLIYMALPLILALITFVVALTKRKAALEQLAEKDENAIDALPASPQQQF